MNRHANHKNQVNAGIEYDHALNQHSPHGAAAALPVLLQGLHVGSMLDVGCGTGVWMRAALNCGVPEVLGVDGVRPDADRLAVPPDCILNRDLSVPWNLDRRFDVVLCLEVGEHLPASAAATLVSALVAHGDHILFSAADPWQSGQHHVNLQWPAYWQQLFNERGFVCRDTLRWKIWGDDRIEPWYRQNVFRAEKAPGEAGMEPRIPGVIHPDYARTMCEDWRRSHESWLVAQINRLAGCVRSGLGVKGGTR